MSPDAQQIATIKSQTLTLMTEITANPKPTYHIDGQSVAWSDYLAQLQKTIDWCNSHLTDTDPFEYSSQACT